MALASGVRLGVYEITASIGAGGMGEVYRATDTSLGRQVAIKILPEAFAADPDRLARFEREAKTLASLNHPNIAAVYGFEKTASLHALVMELVEGDDLSQRIARGAIPLDEALPIAKQIAEALEAAHEQGIVHRDLKPANIKVRADGTVKVLDFGLAKLSSPEGVTPDATNSPTLTLAATRHGVILGTAAYMAPEQARGKTVDKRADIWAFGVVVYEMLTNTRLFAGESVAETLGLIFSREPDLATLPSATPPRVRQLIARCLVKDSRQRLRDIGEARLVLDAPHDTAGLAARQPPPLQRPVWRAAPWGLAAVAVLAAGWAVWGRSGPASTVTPATHLEIGFPRDVEPYPFYGSIAIAPDGRTVAMVGVKEGARHVFIRRLNRAEATELPGSSGANAVAFSPDGGSVAVLATSGFITRMDLADQQQKVVASGVDIAGALAWSPAGIVFARSGRLWIDSLEGGAPRALTVLDAARHEVAHGQPVVLPGTRLMLFVSQTTEPNTDRIEAVSLDGGPQSVVVERATTPVWSPTGHLLFARNGAVLATAFDSRTGTVRGSAVPIMPAGALENLYGSLALSVSPSGTLLYLPGGFTDTRVVSVGRDGASLALGLPSDRYLHPRIAPDGRRLLVVSASAGIVVLDLARGTLARLTDGTSNLGFSTWSTDAKRVMFRRFVSTFWAAADGSGAGGPVPGGTLNDYPSSPGPDPDSMIILRVRPETSGDIFLISTSGAFEPKPLIVTPAYEGGAQLSPDGRWLLYQSDASGRAEIYVRRYPALDRQWQVSESGGVQPRWSRNSRDIFYRSGQRMVAVALDTSAAEPVFGRPMALFADDYDFGVGASIANYDVAPDGRLIMIRRGANGGKMQVVVNWTEELKQLLAAGGVH